MGIQTQQVQFCGLGIMGSCRTTFEGGAAKQNFAAPY